MSQVSPQPLPLNPYNPNTQALLHDAFDQCMQMEANALAGNDGKAQMLARCLGFLILELPHGASEIVAHEVVGCFAEFEKMAELAQIYIDHLIRLCESYFSFNHQLEHANSGLIHF